MGGGAAHHRFLLWPDQRATGIMSQVAGATGADMTSTLMTPGMSKTQSYTSLQVVDGDHVRGPGDAPATILVYGDYQCPYTRAFELSLAELRRVDGGAFRSVYRHFPLREIHPQAQGAAEAAEAVYALGGVEAFWRMHDGLFAHQHHL